MTSNVDEITTLLPWFFPTATFILGAMIGSFLNVVIYRVPANKSIVHPGSHCACGHPIAWYDNIPILSWFILRGKARCCARPYSFRYPAIELLTGVLFLWCWFRFAPCSTGKAVCGMIFVSVLICATFIDLDHMIIPDVFTIWFGLIGVALSALVPALHGQASADTTANITQSILLSTKGLFVGSALVLWIAFLAEHILQKEAMGFGDVKFVGMIGAFCGWQGAASSIFGGAFVGTIWFILALLWQKISGRTVARPEYPDDPAANPGDDAEPEPSARFPAIGTACLAAGVAGVTIAFFRPAIFPTDNTPFLIDSLRSVITALTGLLVGSGAVLSVGLVIETPFKKDWLPAPVVTFVGAAGAFSHWQEGWPAILLGALYAALCTAAIYAAIRLVAKYKRTPTPAKAEPIATATPDGADEPAPLGFGAQIPFGPMLATGALLYFLFADHWVDSYFAQIAEILSQTARY